MKQGSRRTSKSQIFSAFEAIRDTVSAACAHAVRFGFLYGFLGGIIFATSVLSVITWYGVLAYPLPWKVTNPAEQGFEISEFRFSDYSSDNDLILALRIMFPAGTEKSNVDLILVDKAGARIRKNKRLPASPIPPNDTMYYYTYRSIRSVVLDIVSMMPEGEFTWKVSIIYDEDDRIKSINVI